jgi:hypothetical protein
MRKETAPNSAPYYEEVYRNRLVERSELFILLRAILKSIRIALPAFLAMLLSIFAFAVIWVVVFDPETRAMRSLEQILIAKVNLVVIPVAGCLLAWLYTKKMITTWRDYLLLHPSLQQLRTGQKLEFVVGTPTYIKANKFKGQPAYLKVGEKLFNLSHCAREIEILILVKGSMLPEQLRVCYLPVTNVVVRIDQVITDNN